MPQSPPPRRVAASKAPYAMPRRQAPVPSGPRPGMRVAGVLFLLTAVFTLVQPVLLSRWLPSQAATAYPSVGLQVLLGIALLQGSEAARKLVLFVVGIGAVLLLIVAPLFALEIIPLPVELAWLRHSILAVALSSLVGAAGIFGLLFGEPPSDNQVRLAVGAIVLGWAGGVAGQAYMMRSAKSHALKDIEEWVTEERELRQDGLGLRFKVPEGWALLKKENPVLWTPKSLAVAVNRDLPGIAFFQVENASTAVDSPDTFLDRQLIDLRQKFPDLKELSRSDTRLGRTPARKQTLSLTGEDGFKGGAVNVAWNDGWRYFGLLTLFEESTMERAEAEADALFRGLALDFELSQSLGKAREAALAECPHLSKASVEIVFRKNPGHALSPGETFRLAYRMADRGTAQLSSLELLQLGEVNKSVFAAMSARDRSRLGAYMEKVKFGRPTTPDEDRQIGQVMKAAVLSLPEDSREKLRNLIESAIDRASVTD